MNTVLKHSCSKSAYSYQHLHGMMLVNFNKMAFALNLNHTEYRVMGVLIGLWNKEQGKAFPTIEYLSKLCKMSKTTIIKSLEALVNYGLLIVLKQKGKRNNYYLSDRLLNDSGSTNRKPEHSTPWKTNHDNKQKKNKTHIEQKGLCSKNSNNNKIVEMNDIKNTNIRVKKETTLIKELDDLGFKDSKVIVKKFTPNKIEENLNFIKTKTPDNPGAYLRALLEAGGVKDNKTGQSITESNEDTYIKYLAKHPYWKHIPSGLVCKVRPNVGDHFLFRYDSQNNSVKLLDYDIEDKIENFAPSDKITFNFQESFKLDRKPTKLQLIEAVKKSDGAKNLGLISKILHKNRSVCFE